MKKMITVAAIALSAIASSAMASDFYVTGTVGQSDARSTDLSDHKDTSFGVGAGWQFTPQVAATLEFTQYNKFAGSDAKLNNWTAGVKYSF